MKISLKEVIKGKFDRLDSVSPELGYYIRPNRTFFANPRYTSSDNQEDADSLLLPQWLIEDLCFADAQIIAYAFEDHVLESFVSAWASNPSLIIMHHDDAYFGMKKQSMKRVNRKVEPTLQEIKKMASKYDLVSEEVDVLW